MNTFKQRKIQIKIVQNLIQQFQMYDDSNTIENHQWIPEEAFLYLPNGDSKAKVEDDYKMLFKGQIKRLIYEGGIQYNEEEIRKIDAFNQYLRKQQLTLDKRWSKAYLYKFLQSAQYDYKKAMKQILAHNLYKQVLKAKDFDQLRKDVEPYLKKGLFYVNGRDSKYRPIVVCDIAKVNQMKLSDQILFKCLEYFFQFIYRNMFINGQVQNIVGIIDLGFTGPLDMTKPMKSTINFLQANYKYKLHAIYIFRSTSTFKFIYGIAKHLMREDTIRKICIVQNRNIIPQILEYTNPSQLEQRFGGTHKNFEDGEFWPPQIFNKNYFVNSIQRKLISQEEYKKMYFKGLLPQRKIYLDFVVEGSEDEYQIPKVNNQAASLIHIQDNSVFSVISKNKNRLKCFFNRISRFSCFGGQKTERKSKSKSKK